MKRHPAFPSQNVSAEPPASEANTLKSPLLPKSSLDNLFANRASLLDLKSLVLDPATAINLAGFYHFYWIALGVFVFSTFFTNWMEHGYFLKGDLGQLCFSDPIGVIGGELLFLANTLATGLCVFAKFGPFNILRLLLPLMTLCIGTIYGFWRGWSGLQRAIFLLHSLSIIMKIYAFIHYHNGRIVKMKHFRSKMKKFLCFLFAPTMVYSDVYPANARIRKRIVLERLAGVALCGVAMYIVVEQYILAALLVVSLLTPRNIPLVQFVLSIVLAYARLMLPCIAFFLLGFFFVFEYWCNLFAELTCFADRQFYSDWWNGTSFYDFSIRWNIPVHKFLQRYVYREFIEGFKLSKSKSRFLTFLVSSIFHELVMFIMMGPRRYAFAFLFIFQMLQLPLISLVVGSGWSRRNINLANWVFWVMLILGLPSLLILYAQCARR